jgi:hypothetical protein
MALPGWESLETTRMLRNFFEWSGMILLSVALVFECLAYLLGRRKRQVAAEASPVAVMEEPAVRKRKRRKNEARSQV